MISMAATQYGGVEILGFCALNAAISLTPAGVLLAPVATAFNQRLSANAEMAACKLQSAIVDLDAAIASFGVRGEQLRMRIQAHTDLHAAIVGLPVDEEPRRLKFLLVELQGLLKRDFGDFSYQSKTASIIETGESA